MFQFSHENRFNILLTELGKDSLFALVSLLSSSETGQSILCSRYLPLKYFIKPEFLETFQDFSLDFPDEPNFQLLFEVSRSKNLIFSESQGSDSRKETEVRLDFRKNKILEMLSSLMNTNSVEILDLVLKEIHEYLIFSEKIDSFEMIFNIMVMLICIYHQNHTIFLLCIQNIFNLISNDPKKALEVSLTNGFSSLIIEYLTQSLKKPIERSDVLRIKLDINGWKSFELIGIKPEKLEKMQKKEIETRLYQNFLVIKSSFSDGRMSLRSSSGKNTSFPEEFEKTMKYMLRITDYLLDNGQKINNILEILKNFYEFLSKNRDLAWLFLNLCEKYLINPDNLASISNDFLKILLKLTCAMLQNPNLSAKEEDQYLRKLENFFSFGNKKTQTFWTSNERNQVILAIIEAIRVNNSGNSQDFLINEFFLLEKTLESIEKTSEICELLKKSTFLKTLYRIFFGDYLEKRGLVGFFISDRLFAMGISLVLLFYKKFDAKEWEDMKLFFGELKKLEKDKGGSLGEVRKKALQSFWKEILDSRSLEEIKAMKGSNATKEKKGNGGNVTKKYLVSKLDWMN